MLDLLWTDRDPKRHPGDNIIVDLDHGHANLPAGALLRAGTAVLRVSAAPNAGCAKWKVCLGRDAYA
jgi:hypothetical protein